VRFPGTVTVAPYRFVLDRNQANAAASRRLAGELECAGAEARWHRARRRMVHRSDWLEANGPDVRRALAECWVALAARSADREEQAERIARARRLDPEAPALRTTARELAAALFAAGEEAHAAEDWSESYRCFRAAVRIDPRLAWARRYAEEARIHRLALTTQVRAW
jgi:tetratricopeptide (TPR) repeat protein